jgi:hypothetical protein
MLAFFPSKLEMFFTEAFWLWGGPLPVVLISIAALLAHIGDKYQNGEL